MVLFINFFVIYFLIIGDFYVWDMVIVGLSCLYMCISVFFIGCSGIYSFCFVVFILLMVIFGV